MRQDRRELAVLGLLVLGWGLLVAPVVHAFEHAHGHQHSHGAPAKQQAPHANAGTLEHLLAVGTEAPRVEVPLFIARVIASLPERAPAHPHLAKWFSVEQPQGP